MILLTDEEILGAVKATAEKDFKRVPDDWFAMIEYTRKLSGEIYLAVAKVQLKKVVEWCGEYCTHRQGISGIQNMAKRYCEDCWQVLLEEVNE